MPRDPLNRIRVVFLAVALFVAVRGRPGEAAIVLVLLGATVLPRLLGLPRPFEAALLLALSLQAIGGVLGLFRPDFGYDILVHTVLTAAAGACAYLTLVRLGALPDPAARRGENRDLEALLVTAALGMALGSLWEVVEAGSDELFGTALVRGPLDTSVDLLANAIGAFGGGAMLVGWARRGTWGETQAENTRRVV